MISDGTLRATESGSTESLLDFLNTASSSVKNVLARPGCFKRNTNHRRFLQKQLKVSKQRGDSTSSKKKAASKHHLAMAKTRQRAVSRKRELAMSPESRIPKLDITTDRFRVDGQKGGQISYVECKEDDEHKREMRYLAECKKFSEMVDDLVDNLLDSSSNCSQHQEKTQGDVVGVNSFYRSGSVSSYSSSSEEEISPDFLSGEELLRCLDISELFIPEISAGAAHQRQFETSSPTDELQIVPDDESPVHEHLTYDTMPIFENVFQQFSL